MFPVAFVQYSTSLFDVHGQFEGALLKGVFILLILVTNVIGIKAVGRFNDVLTVVKLLPLLLLIVAGIVFMLLSPSVPSSNFSPFMTGTIGDFGQALVLIFWAYAGFELSTLPADEIDSPRKTISKAIVSGMMIVVAFYLLTNLVIIGTVDSAKLATSTSPLMDSASEIFASTGGFAGIAPIIIGVGALISILGADESGTIGTSRLAYALSLDGLMPRALSRIHRKLGTPYVAITALCLTAYVASAVGSLVQLINASVFLLSFVYLATCASAIKFHMKESRGTKLRYVIPVCGLLFSICLMSLVNISQILISVVLMLVGLPIYWFFSPKHELHELKKAFMSREAVLKRTYEQGERFLAYPWRRLLWLVYGRTRTKKAWVVVHEPRKSR